VRMRRNNPKARKTSHWSLFCIISGMRTCLFLIQQSKTISENTHQGLTIA